MATDFDKPRSTKRLDDDVLRGRKVYVVEAIPNEALGSAYNRIVTFVDQEKCVGDVLWRPIARTGPIVTETKLRALTLVELTDLPRMIKRDKQVLLMLAPCGMCHEPKGELLDTILNLDPSQQIVTNVVVDSVTAGQMLRSG